MKKLTLYFCALLLLGSIPTTSFAQWGIFKGDLVVKDLNIHWVHGHACKVDFTVKNIGLFGKVDLGEMMYEAFVSKDLSLDESDPAAGGYSFGYFAPTLSFGQSYTVTFNTNTSADIQEYKYLYIRVKTKPNATPQETNIANNTTWENQSYFFADLSVEKLQAVNVKGRKMDFKYTIKNLGTQTLRLDKYGFKAYISKDGSTNAASSILVANRAFTTDDINFLYPGETLEETILVGDKGVKLDEYYHLIFKTYLLPGEYEPEKSTSNNSENHPMLFDFADLSIYPVEISQINGNQVSFHYTIRNNGQSTLYVDNYYFQVYLSNNTSLETATDVNAGGSIISDAPIAINFLETYTGYFSFTSPVNLELYPHLFFDVRLRNGYVHPQMNKMNDHYLRGLEYVFSDAAIEKMKTDSLTEQSGALDFTVANLGQSILHLDRFKYNIYQSSNHALDPTSDFLVATGSFNGEPILLDKGQTKDVHVSLPTIKSPFQYPVLIVEIKLKQGEINPERLLTNNWKSEFVAGYVNNSRTAAEEESAAYSLQTTAESVSILHLTKNQLSSSYILYSLAGEKIKEGSFDEQVQLSTATLQQGLYIIQVSDGNTHDTFKLFIAQ